MGTIKITCNNCGAEMSEQDDRCSCCNVRVDDDSLVGNVIKVPKTISETGFIKIWAQNTQGNTLLSYGRWDYKAKSYCPVMSKTFGSSFDISKEELEEWQRKQKSGEKN